MAPRPAPSDRNPSERAESPLPAGSFVTNLADPGPLGLAAFAGTTFFLSVVNSGMLGDSVQTVVLGLALFYGGLAQLLAGMWEFVKGNTFGALAFTSYGAFWMSFWYLLNHLPTSAPEKDLFHGVGVYLLVWTIFTAYMTVAATRTTGAILAVFALLTLTFLALAIGWLDNHSSGWIHLGGYIGILTAIAAWYASFAGVVNATFRRVVLPTMPR
jgi:hypothetical protein